MADGIIDRIDSVIEDWQTGPDAMRWTAEPPTRGDQTGLTVPCDGNCGETDPHNAHLAPGALDRLAGRA